MQLGQHMFGGGDGLGILPMPEVVARAAVAIVHVVQGCRIRETVTGWTCQPCHPSRSVTVQVVTGDA